MTKLDLKFWPYKPRLTLAATACALAGLLLAVAALRALADHYADTGQTAAAIATYEELLEKVRASSPQLEADLRHANQISRIYRDLGSLHRRAGHANQAGMLDQQRLELWRYLDWKLPNNPFVWRQLAAAAIR